MAESRNHILGLSDVLVRFPEQFSKEGCFFSHNSYIYEVVALRQLTYGGSYCSVCATLCKKLGVTQSCWLVEARRIYPATSGSDTLLPFGICSPFSMNQTGLTDDSIKSYHQFIRKEQRGNRWTNIEVTNTDSEK